MKCQECGDDVDEIEKLKVGGRTMKLCEDCAEIKREEQEIGEAAEGAVQDMMGYKGRW
jgi:ribosome-binding protein aMBF1 (putative translation factor)